MKSQHFQRSARRGINLTLQNTVRTNDSLRTEGVLVCQFPKPFVAHNRNTTKAHSAIIQEIGTQGCDKNLLLRTEKPQKTLRPIRSIPTVDHRGRLRLLLVNTPICRRSNRDTVSYRIPLWESLARPPIPR